MRVTIKCEDGKHRRFETVEEYEHWVSEYLINRTRETDTMILTMSDSGVVT